jgi:hypothetical protein
VAARLLDGTVPVASAHAHRIVDAASERAADALNVQESQ